MSNIEKFDKLRDYLKEYLVEYFDDFFWFDSDMEEILTLCRPIIEQEGWISVEEPPKQFRKYLCYDENIQGYDKEAIYRFDEFRSRWFDGSDEVHPQYWRELPKPPSSKPPVK